MRPRAPACCCRPVHILCPGLVGASPRSCGVRGLTFQLCDLSLRAGVVVGLSVVQASTGSGTNGRIGLLRGRGGVCGSVIGISRHVALRRVRWGSAKLDGNKMVGRTAVSVRTAYQVYQPRAGAVRLVQQMSRSVWPPNTKLTNPEVPQRHPHRVPGCANLILVHWLDVWQGALLDVWA